MNKKLNIGILCGGKSAEHEVSLQSAKNVYEAIDREKYNPFLIGITKNGNWLYHTHNTAADCIDHADDPAKISLKFLLELFYEIIDPTSLNRQGFDVGTQYRSGIYYVDEADKEIILSSINLLQEGYEKKIVIEQKQLDNFFPAEQHHQKYLDKNPGGYCHIDNAMFAKARYAN